MLPQATYAKQRRAYAESGLLSAAQDYDIVACNCPIQSRLQRIVFAAASISIGSNLLTSGNASLLDGAWHHLQKQGICAQ